MIGNRNGRPTNTGAPVQAKVFLAIASRKTSQNSAVDYGVAVVAGEGMLIVVFVSVFSVVAGDGFTIVVFVSFFS